MVPVSQTSDIPAKSEIVMESEAIAYEPILNFWFGSLESPSHIPKDKSKTWFMKDASFDELIKNSFLNFFDLAKDGSLTQWSATPKGRLALIILCDQFSRNVFRGTEKAFAFDSIALHLTLEGMKIQHDLALHPVERSFFYLPLEHSEDLAMQEKSILAYTQLLEDAPEDVKEFFSLNLDYAHRHKVIIDQFGRYPHRNDALGRVSSAKEIDFLDKPGSSF